MIAFLMLACDGAPVEATPAPPVQAPPVEAPPAAPATPEVTPAAWVGDWVMAEYILSTDPAGELRLMEGGEVVMSGTLEGEGLTRTAALQGCGATLTLAGVGGDLTMALDGPECPVSFIGTYTNTVSP